MRRADDDERFERESDVEGIVENFKSVDVELREALATMRAIGGDDGDDGDDMEVDNADVGAMEAEARAAKREETMRECWRLVEEIRPVDAELEDLKRRVLSASTAEVSQRDDGGTPTPSAPKFESMNLTQLRGVYRDVYGAPAPKGHKKAWFVRRFSKLDLDVVASALAATQPERATPSIVIAYSSSARRQNGAQDARLAEVERKIAAVDADARVSRRQGFNERVHALDHGHRLERASGEEQNGQVRRGHRSRAVRRAQGLVGGVRRARRVWKRRGVRDDGRHELERKAPRADGWTATRARVSSVEWQASVRWVDDARERVRSVVIGVGDGEDFGGRR